MLNKPITDFPLIFGHFLGQAVTVGVTMYVLSISELSEVQMVKMVD